MKRIIAFVIIITTLLSVTACALFAGEDTVKFDKKDSLVIAHRGLSGLETENTDRAFIAAGKRSYYGIEADVRKTADGYFVICHDDNLERISGKNINVESSILAELMEIPLIDKQGRGGVYLTDLAGYISICKKHDKQAILELKSSFSEEEIASIIEIIRSFDYLGRVIFISFGYDNLLHVRKFSPNQTVQYLFSEVTDDVVEKLTRDKIDVGIKYTAINRESLEKFHSAGLKVNCWTVDSKLIAEQLADMGVDYITTNILE